MEGGSNLLTLNASLLPQSFPQRLGLVRDMAITSSGQAKDQELSSYYHGFFAPKVGHGHAITSRDQ